MINSSNLVLQINGQIKFFMDKWYYDEKVEKLRVLVKRGFVKVEEIAHLPEFN